MLTYLQNLKQLPKEFWYSILVVLFIVVFLFIVQIFIEDANDYREADRNVGYSLPDWTIGGALKRIFGKMVKRRC